MNDLATKTVAAHGGLNAWRRYTSVHAHLSQGGGLWDMKANGAQIADVGVVVATDRQWVSHAPFGRSDLRSSFSRDRVTIESTDGRVIQELLAPRSSFAGHQLSTPWTDLHWPFSSAAPCGHTSTCPSCSHGLASRVRGRAPGANAARHGNA